MGPEPLAQQYLNRELVIMHGISHHFWAYRHCAMNHLGVLVTRHVCVCRVIDCAACGNSPTITSQTLPGYSYSDFTGQAPHDSGPPELQVLPRDQRSVVITPSWHTV